MKNKELLDSYLKKNEEMPELPPKCNECNNMGHKKLYFNDEYIYLCYEHYDEAKTENI